MILTVDTVATVQDMWKTMEGPRYGKDDQEVYLGHTDFDISIRNPKDDISLGFREKL